MINVKVTRDKILHELRQDEPTTVGMEARYSSRPWGRTIQELGHIIKLIPPIKVKPFVQGNKNDSNEAVAIAEANQRPNIRFVPVKSLSVAVLLSLKYTNSSDISWFFVEVAVIKIACLMLFHIVLYL